MTLYVNAFSVNGRMSEMWENFVNFLLKAIVCLTNFKNYGCLCTITMYSLANFRRKWYLFGIQLNKMAAFSISKSSVSKTIRKRNGCSESCHWRQLAFISCFFLILYLFSHFYPIHIHIWQFHRILNQNLQVSVG